jgi:hypothetical protein
MDGLIGSRANNSTLPVIYEVRAEESGFKTEWLILRMVYQPEAAIWPACADPSRHGR